MLFHLILFFLNIITVGKLIHCVQCNRNRNRRNAKNYSRVVFNENVEKHCFIFLQYQFQLVLAEKIRYPELFYSLTFFYPQISNRHIK